MLANKPAGESERREREGDVGEWVGGFARLPSERASDGRAPDETD